MLKPITNIETPFRQKFGVPRQSLLVDEAIGVMVFPKNDFYLEAFRGIEKSSHLWLIFTFHLIESEDLSALIRPPRFKGQKKLGVFATRSPHRPNKLGLSVVKFRKIDIFNDKIQLEVGGVDLVSGTPILDIKPYLPYVDRIESAKSEDFMEPPQMSRVVWSCEKPSDYLLIEKIIALDPRPSYEMDPEKEYGVSISGKNIRFSISEEVAFIKSINLE